MPTKFEIFLDTSAILAGLNSPTGAAGGILAACFNNEIIPVISPQIIEEAERNIPIKFRGLLPAWQSFLLIPPKVTPEPTLREVKQAYKILPTSDAPILASALKIQPDAFVTWNTRHFHRAEVQRTAAFPIVTPGEFLRIFKSDLGKT